MQGMKTAVSIKHSPTDQHVQVGMKVQQAAKGLDAHDRDGNTFALKADASLSRTVPYRHRASLANNLRLCRK